MYRVPPELCALLPSHPPAVHWALQSSLEMALLMVGVVPAQREQLQDQLGKYPPDV